MSALPRLVTFYRYVLPVALGLQFLGFPPFVTWVARLSGHHDEVTGLYLLAIWCLLLGAVCYRQVRWARNNYPDLAERYWFLFGLTVLALALCLIGLLLDGTRSFGA